MSKILRSIKSHLTTHKHQSEPTNTPSSTTPAAPVETKSEDMSTPKASLYWFQASVWASVPRLGLLEKGYSSEDVDLKSVNLLQGENFAPEFLMINPSGTLPVLVVPLEGTTSPDVPTKFKSIVGTVPTLEFIDSHRLSSSTSADSTPAPALAPATPSGKAESDALIALVHADDAPDPNFLLVSARTEEELKAKSASIPGAFARGRQEALEKYSAAAGDSDPALKKFYEEKLAANGGLVALYDGKADAAGFLQAGQAAWANLGKTLTTLESKIQGPYLLGEQFSLADIHVGSWLARLFLCAGHSDVSQTEAALAALEAQLPDGGKIGPKVKALWTTYATRPSFQSFYGELGLH